MNISFEKVNEVNALLTLSLVKADYEENVNKALKDFRKKAQMPGFRPGQVPMGLLKKRFGTEITAEEVNKILGKELTKYIHDEKINVLGEPLPNEEKTPAIDFDTQEDFTFVFDVALAPEFDAKVSDKDELDYYDITVDDAMVDKQVQVYAQRAGEYSKVDFYEERDMVKGILTQLGEDGQPVEGGLQKEDAVMLPGYMKNDEEKAKFNGLKVNDVIVINLAKAYDNNDVEVSSLLGITKEQAAEAKSDFSYQVTEITRFVPAEVNQELFDKILGEGKVNGEEEFRASIAESMKQDFAADSEFKFARDLRAYLTKRIGTLQYPEEMLKRIMKLNNKDKDDEYIERNFKPSLDELTWHLIKEQLCDQLEVKIQQEDVLETAKMATRMQFAQYGMTNVPEDALTHYANEMLKNEQQAEALVTRAVENKIVEKAKAVVKLNHKQVTMDEFNKMMSEKEA